MEIFIKENGSMVDLMGKVIIFILEIKESIKVIGRKEKKKVLDNL